MIRQALKVLAYSVCATALIAGAQDKNSSDPLKSGFQNPPQTARPRVWWHWMNGNITKEGIKLDLDWMHHVGLAGFQNFDAALQTPQVVDHRLAYMTPEWKDAFKYAITVGDQYGMEMAIAGSPGWSESGGPWVPGLKWRSRDSNRGKVKVRPSPRWPRMIVSFGKRSKSPLRISRRACSAVSRPNPQGEQVSAG